MAEKELTEAEKKKLDRKIEQLEKIAMIRQLDGVYRLDHAVTKQEKVILDAFGLSDNNIRIRAEKLGQLLDKIMNHPKKGGKE